MAIPRPFLFGGSSKFGTTPSGGVNVGPSKSMMTLWFVFRKRTARMNVEVVRKSLV
jgi:hypothetical protein